MQSEFIKITRKRYDAMVRDGLSKEVIAAKLGFNQVKVIYGIKEKKPLMQKLLKKEDTKVFDLNNWFLFREGIVTNLYDKGLVKIKFI